MTKHRTLTTEYNKTETIAAFQGKTITVTHIIPVLSPEEREKRKREIEHQLYDVFAKYDNTDYRVG